MRTVFLSEKRDLKDLEKSALVLGNFDGVHEGHSRLFLEASSYAKEESVSWVVMTFEPHPKEYFSQEGFKRIYGPEDSLLALERAGIEVCLISEFDESLANKSPVDFLNEITLKMKPSLIVVGEDFQFGKNREGSVKDIQDWCREKKLQIKVVDLFKNQNDIKVSSTLIRKFLEMGDVSHANKMLCSHFFIRGKAKREKGLASQLGFPTINVPFLSSSNLRFGVYATQILLENKFYSAITNYGMRPTIDDSKVISMETHVLDFPLGLEDIEFADVEVQYLSFIRPESRFESVEGLKEQIQKDVLEAKDFFNNNL